MSGAVILAMTLVSAAATIAVGGFDILSSPPADSREPAAAEAEDNTPVALHPTSVVTVTATAARVVPKAPHADAAFAKYVHDTIAFATPKYDATSTGGGSTHWYFSALVKYVCHRFTLDTDADEHQKFLAAVALLCRKDVDLLIKGVALPGTTAALGATGAAGSAAVSADTWTQMRWGNRNKIVVLNFDGDARYAAAVVDGPARTVHFVATADTEPAARAYAEERAQLASDSEQIAAIAASIQTLGTDVAALRPSTTKVVSMPMIPEILPATAPALEKLYKDILAWRAAHENESYYAAQVSTAASAGSRHTLKYYLDNSSFVFLPACDDRRALLAVLAALVAGSDAVADQLDRTSVSRLEADDLWRVVLEGLEDHGRNTDAYDASMRPDEKKPPPPANYSGTQGCPKRNRFKKPGGTFDKIKFNWAVEEHNRKFNAKCPKA